MQSTFTNPIEVLHIFNGSNPPETIFLDIDMPGINRLDFTRLIGNKSQVILTTSFRNHGSEAFELSVRGYLLKPFFYKRFLEAVKKVLPGESSKKPPLDFFFGHTETRGVYAKVEVPDILFVESNDNLVRINLSSGKITATYQLAEIETWLPPAQFSRVHRSFNVNLAQVNAIDHGQVHLKDGTRIPIGRKYKEQFIAKLQQLTINGPR